MAQSLRILYAAGPGNVLGTYRYWRDGKDDPTQIAITYSGQFYDVCREMDAHAWVVATCQQPGKLSDPNFRIIHRPVPLENCKGFFYHFGQIWYGLRLLFTALRMHANVAIICAGTHWFMLYLFRLFGIRVIATLHCVLHRKYNWKPTLFQRLVQKLNGWFFSSDACDAIITVSAEITQQVHDLTGNRSRPIYQFIPQYRRGSFSKIKPADLDAKPARILYVGRIERNKGVFDVLEIAQRLAASGRQFIFDLCGTGSAIHELRKRIDSTGMTGHVVCHGHCDHETMIQMYTRAHIVIVPTTTDFSEGFNKVVAEGVLAGRPVVTSSVCPALAELGDAVVEVPPDDVAAYANAIVHLCENRAYYQSKVDACTAVQGQFYDPQRGWAAALREILNNLENLPAQTPPQWIPHAKTAGKLT